MKQIKTKIIETPKARVLVVGGLPTDAFDMKVAKNRIYYKVWWDYNNDPNVVIQKGNWQLLGKLSEITEEQWKGIVHSYKTMLQGSDTIYFKNYKTEGGFDTATESGLSLIECECFDYQNPIIFYEPK